MIADLGIPAIVQAVDVDESTVPGEAPDDFLVRVVAAKMAAAVALPEAARCAAILVADTVVLHDGCILGKPADDVEAQVMLTAMAGGPHDVAGRFAIASGAIVEAQTVRTRVWFRELDTNQIARYIACGEGRDKAGSYAIQGVGAFIVERIEGSHSNVIGLPLCEVVAALQRLELLGACPV